MHTTTLPHHLVSLERDKVRNLFALWFKRSILSDLANEPFPHACPPGSRNRSLILLRPAPTRLSAGLAQSLPTINSLPVVMRLLQVVTRACYGVVQYFRFSARSASPGPFCRQTAAATATNLRPTTLRPPSAAPAGAVGDAALSAPPPGGAGGRLRLKCSSSPDCTTAPRRGGATDCNGAVCARLHQAQTGPGFTNAGSSLNRSICIASHHREPWNKGKLVGQKAPLRLKEIWAFRIRRQGQLAAGPGAKWFSIDAFRGTKVTFAGCRGLPRLHSQDVREYQRHSRWELLRSSF